MSGQSGISPVDQMLRDVDLAGIQDERARECIRLLLNLIESLTADLRKAQAENLHLREQVNRGKGGGGKPDQPKDTARAKSQSSEKERAETKQRTRRGKLERVRIDREEVLKLDRAALPPDAQFKGYQEVVVQELRIGTDNVKFRKEKYYAPSTGQTYLAPLPAGYHDEFGPNLKSLCLLFSHLCNMTEPKIADLLDNFGIVISSGQISAWLTGAYPGIQEEKRAIVEAGLASSPWQHMDDTGTRVDGENHHCQILCNPLYGAYFTNARKDRLTIIDVLRNGRPRVFRIKAPERAAQLREKFDELFSTVTGYDELDQRIARTKADKTYLLMVLDHPEVPLHNNPAELDARTRVRKRVVSYGPRSLAGTRTWDAMETLLSTARKLGVNFFQYIRDRVSGARQMPSLADLIKQRAETMDLGSSWKPI